MHRERCPSRARDRRGGDDHGSAVVTAVALAGVVILLGGALALRSVAETRAATGVVERAQARTLAELGLGLAMEELEHGALSEDIRRGRAIDATLEVDAVAPGGPERIGPDAELRISVSGEHPHRRLDVEVEAVVGAATHRASSVLRPTLVSDHVLLSEVSAIDPSVLGVPRAGCSWGVLDARQHPGCLAGIQGPGLIAGPVHSADHLVLGGGAGVEGAITSARLRGGGGDAWAPTVLDASLAPVPTETVEVRHAPAMELPRDARGVLDGLPVTCRFRGPTLLRFDGSSLRVRSPGSVPRAGDATSGPDALGCVGLDRSLLGGVVAVELPQRVVIEVVRDVGAPCGAHPLGVPDSEDLERDWPCDAGDAFLWGRYRGERTVVAEDSAQLVWDLEPGDATSTVRAPGDAMAIVAGDSVVLRRTVTWPPRTRLALGANGVVAGPGVAPFGDHPADAPVASASRWDAPRIVASLTALRGAVRIQNSGWGQLSPGTLTIEGAVAGRFAPTFHREVRSSTGALVGTVGYEVDIRHDPRHVAEPLLGVPRLEGGALRILDIDLDASPVGEG